MLINTSATKIQKTEACAGAESVFPAKILGSADPSKMAVPVKHPRDVTTIHNRGQPLAILATW